MLNSLKSNNNIDLNLLILDEDCSKEEYNNFITQYNKNNKDLCLKKNGTKPQNIFQFIPREYIKKFWKDMNYNIYYISEKKKIIAFCLIKYNKIDKIIEVILLCSSIEKKFINGISLGKYLLNIIYDNFVEKEQYLMKIQPATDELIPYYRGWKIPSFNDLDETSGYLIYGNLKIASIETLTELFMSFQIINRLKKYLKLNINTNKMNNLQELKKIFKEKLDKNNKYSNSDKNQLSNMIDSLKYVNPKQIKNNR